MTTPHDLSQRTRARIQEKLGLHEQRPPLPLRSPLSPTPVGEVRVLAGGPLCRLVYVALGLPQLGLDSHMLFAATPPAEPAKPAVTNQTIRKKAAVQLKRCGKDGTIEVTATYVLAEGRLFQPKVKVTGEAAKDPAVKTCAEKVAKGIKLLRLKANEVASFEPLVVKI